VIPVLVFEPEVVGCYKAGEIIEGEQADLLLDNHPDYFIAAQEEEQ
jgi:hypothetical protein